MTIGTGIVIAVLLGIIAWQLDKRGAWKKAGRAFLWFIALVAVIVGGIAGYAYWEDWHEEQAKKREAEEERSRIESVGMKEYFGVTLGMTEDEVLYILGEPEIRVTEGGTPYWEYKKEYSDHAKVVFFEEGKVDQLQCIGGGPYDCPSIAGVFIGDVESHLHEALGTALQKPVIKEGQKLYVAGPIAARVLFGLQQQHVKLIGIMDGRKSRPEPREERM